MEENFYYLLKCYLIGNLRFEGVQPFMFICREKATAPDNVPHIQDVLAAGFLLLPGAGQVSDIIYIQLFIAGFYSPVAGIFGYFTITNHVQYIFELGDINGQVITGAFG